MYSFDSRWSLVPAAGLLLGLASCVNLTGGNGDTMTVASSGHGARLEFETWDGKSEAATFMVISEDDGLRRYRQTSTAEQRDDAHRSRDYAEHPDLPRVRSGDLAFDALFALAVEEMRLDAVSEIRDDAYNGGEAIPCDCFETGAKWHYVWTRDLSYAAWLGLGMLEPERVRNSLVFKLSGYRDEAPKPAAAAGTPDGLQIIQDTGSGGSWPVSTDRVSWTFGARSALYGLSGVARRDFAELALKAITNTLDNDRLAAFDEATGLFTGEQSFLDWREQSYASWIPDDLSSMATAKALSTNAGVYHAMTLAAELAHELRRPAVAGHYEGQARALKAAINRHLWLEEAGLYSSLTAGLFDGRPLHKFDWLGQSLAILTGIADGDKRARILSAYPHGPMGAPVIFPQQPGIPVYHNRAIWPFVTAYGLRAARLGNNVAVADSAIELLIRGAALNLSNMENLEWLSAQAMWEEPGNAKLSGPVINSQRQLWSVAAYLGLVVNDVFGIETTSDGLRIAPWITARLRDRYLGPSDHLELRNLRLWGKRLDVIIELPAATEAAGVFEVSGITINGAASDGAIARGDLADSNVVRIALGAAIPADTRIRQVASTPGRFDEAVFAPYEPAIDVSRKDRRVVVTIVDGRNTGNVEYRLFRNGELLASNLTSGAWTDEQPLDGQACYSAVAVFRSSGNRSHHSRPQCTLEGLLVAVDDRRVSSNRPVTRRRDSPVIEGWGVGDEFTVEGIRIERAGNYALQVRYANHEHTINTGITNGVKWLNLVGADGAAVAGGVIQLPHNSPERPPTFSTALEAFLPAGDYRLQVADFYNMSYLANNRTYSAAGGSKGPVNRVDIFALRVMPMPD